MEEEEKPKKGKDVKILIFLIIASFIFVIVLQEPLIDASSIASLVTQLWKDVGNRTISPKNNTNVKIDGNITIISLICLDEDCDHIIKKNTDGERFNGIADDAIIFSHEEKKIEGAITFLMTHQNHTQGWWQVGRNNSYSGTGNSFGVVPNYWGEENFTNPDGTINMTLLSDYIVICDTFGPSLGVECEFFADTRGRGMPLTFTGDLEVWLQAVIHNGLSVKRNADFSMNGNEFNVFNGSIHNFIPVTFQSGFTEGAKFTIATENFQGGLGIFQNDADNILDWITGTNVLCGDDRCAIAQGNGGPVMMNTTRSSLTVNQTQVTFSYALVGLVGLDSFNVYANNNTGSGDTLVYTDSGTVATTTTTIDLDGNFSNTSAVTFQVACNATQLTRFCYFDTFIFNGTIIEDSTQNVSGFNSELCFSDGIRGADLNCSRGIIYNSATDTIYIKGPVNFSGAPGAGGISGSGSVNNIAKWASPSSLTNANIVDDGSSIAISTLTEVTGKLNSTGDITTQGNLGVGIGTPTEELHVIGNGIINGTPGVVGSPGTNADPVLTVVGGAGGNGTTEVLSAEKITDSGFDNAPDWDETDNWDVDGIAPSGARVVADVKGTLTEIIPFAVTGATKYKIVLEVTAVGTGNYNISIGGTTTGNIQETGTVTKYLTTSDTTEFMLGGEDGAGGVIISSVSVKEVQSSGLGGDGADAFIDAGVGGLASNPDDDGDAGNIYFGGTTGNVMIGSTDTPIFPLEVRGEARVADAVVGGDVGSIIRNLAPTGNIGESATLYFRTGTDGISGSQMGKIVATRTENYGAFDHQSKMEFFTSNIAGGVGAEGIDVRFMYGDGNQDTFVDNDLDVGDDLDVSGDGIIRGGSLTLSFSDLTLTSGGAGTPRWIDFLNDDVNWRIGHATNDDFQIRNKDRSATVIRITDGISNHQIMHIDDAVIKFGDTDGSNYARFQASGNLQFFGVAGIEGLVLNTFSFNANRTYGPFDDMFFMNASDGEDLFYLLPDSVDGKLYSLKNVGSSGLTTLMANSSETIDGSPTFALSPNQSVTVMGDGSNWHITNYYQAGNYSVGNFKIGSSGSNLYFYNSTGSIVMRLNDTGGLAVRGTIQENWDGS